MKYWYSTILSISLILGFAGNLYGQSWDFVKVEDGIKLYTRKELNSAVKAYKGEVVFMANIDKVNLLVGDANNTDWWTKDFSKVKVLDFKKNTSILYYIVFNVPGPLVNRDLVLDEQISFDPLTGARIVTEKPISNLVPERPDMVRIKKYWQKWTVQPLGNGFVKIILEGYVDPNGNVPSWLSNMVITDTPLKVLQSLRERATSHKPLVN